MSEPLRKYQGMKTTLVGVIGFFVTLTAKQWSDLGAALAGFATGIFMLIRSYYFLKEKWVVKTRPKRKNRRYEED